MDTISVQDPRVLLESLLRLGPSHDGAVERDLRSAIDRQSAELVHLRAEVERLQKGQWKPGDPRCDFCDNGVLPDWAYCPYCSRVLNHEIAAARAALAPDGKGGE